ncbi:VWA domain-containing protein [Chloracidobacterium sp. D]|uniref:nitric oxide reductase activation protein NorD n=1 Tax=Chloracidobacterium sp. D TaxID=2821536 RepID=UPI001B8D3010|nr:VWA domain-containing protein [Chloracidobacterium sp. D]QUV82789.1 VWA domain-containing protein [Chloracidobacterium sp. D]
MAESQLRAKLRQLFKGSDAAEAEQMVPRLAGIPTERLLFLTSIGAGLASLSPRTALEFFRVTPEVATQLTSFELQAWGECGKRLASTNVEAAYQFFRASPQVFEALPSAHRLSAIVLTTRQATMSTRTAVETFQMFPSVVSRIDSTPVLPRLLSIVNEVARHSVRHSQDLLRQSPVVVTHVRTFDSPDQALLNRLVEMTAAFAYRAGGTAAEFFLAIPNFLTQRTHGHLNALLEHTQAFLERGGSLALYYLRAATAVVQQTGHQGYEPWRRLALTMCAQGNTNSYQFLKLTPEVMQTLAASRSGPDLTAALRLLCETVADLDRVDRTAALECFKSAPLALRQTNIEHFRNWALAGLAHHPDGRAVQAYYGLQSRASRAALQGGQDGVALDTVSAILRLYVEGLTGRSVTIVPLSSAAEQSVIGDGRTIPLPGRINDFADEESNFRLYKVLAAHGAGQIEYGTHAADTPELIALRQDFQAAFPTAPPPTGREPVTYRTLLRHFPDPATATRLFTILENARIDRRLRRAYRGIRRDLDFIAARLRETRPDVLQLPPEHQWTEILFRIALCGGVDAVTRQQLPHIVTALEQIVTTYLDHPTAALTDTLLATQRIYDIIEQVQPSDATEAAVNEVVQQPDDAPGEAGATEVSTPSTSPASPSPPQPGQSFETWSQEHTPSQHDLTAQFLREGLTDDRMLEADGQAFFYDEWDRELGDYRVNWCRVIEHRPTAGTRTFVELTRARHQGLISSIRHQFQLMKPEALRRVTGELDGEMFDLDAVIDRQLDRRAALSGNERIYIKHLRRHRNVAVAFLLDMSSSTARTLTRYPRMPYTRPGQRIIDIEKEGLVIMNEALEAVGDSYAIYGFTSEGRRNVRFYVIKEFEERYSAQIEERIGGINYQNNTRLGAAVRHAVCKLTGHQARTKLLILLSDGRPYDHDYGDARYAREDSKQALRSARQSGITPFCITIERDADQELRELYGDVGYTVIDDVLSLPEKLPGIYRRLTS